MRQGKHIVMSNGRRIVTIPRRNPVNMFTIAVSPATPVSAWTSFALCRGEEGEGNYYYCRSPIQNGPSGCMNPGLDLVAPRLLSNVERVIGIGE